MTLAEYETAVRAELARCAAGDDRWAEAARDVIPDLDASDAFADPHERGFSVRDAARSIMLTADTWDEAWAIEAHRTLREKYKSPSETR